MKNCSKCLKFKPLSDFSSRSKAKGTLSAWCRACTTAYDKIRWSDPVLIEQKRLRNSKRRKRNRLFLYDYLSKHPCVDCGETDPVVLQFDHQKDKIRNVSDMAGTACSSNLIMEEISKCHVVCANCHCRRTSKTFGWYKFLNGG